MRISVFNFVSVAKPQTSEKETTKHLMSKIRQAKHTPSEYTSSGAICETGYDALVYSDNISNHW